MSLAGLLHQSFPHRLVVRGDEYFAEGRIHLEQVTGGIANARVRGSHGAVYSLRISAMRENGRLGFLFSCDCPFAEGERICKHGWAAVRELDRQGLSHLLAEEARQAPDLPPLLTGPPERVARNRAERRPPAGPRPLTWRSLLSRLEPHRSYSDLSSYPAPAETEPQPCREIWYGFSPEESTTEEVLLLHLYQRERRVTGTLGTIKQLRATNVTRREVIHPEDAEILDQLLSVRAEVPGSWRYSYSGGASVGVSQVRIEPAALDRLLPVLCATGRFFLNEYHPGRFGSPVDQPPDRIQALSWDGGEPWEVRLVLVPHDETAYRVEISVRRGEERLPAEEAQLLPSLRLLLRGSTLYRLRGEIPPDLASVLQKRGPCLVPRAQLEPFLEQASGMSRPPRIDLPEESGWQEELGTPRPRLRLSPPPPGRSRGMIASAVFDYGTRLVEAGEPARGFLDRDSRRIVRRNRQAERAFERRLDELGLPLDRGSRAAVGERSLPLARLSEVAYTLSAEGWTIESERFSVRQGGTWRGRISSGIDWFELDGEFDFGGASAGLPDVLRAIEEQSAWVRLSDGTLGMIPHDWVDRLAVVAGFGTKKDGKVRFHRAQGALLDALLAAEGGETTKDSAFQRLGEELQGFDGVRPQSAPRGFRGDLREYQKLGLGWLQFLRRFGFGGCLADDMGLGKTVQVLALLAGLPRNGTQNGKPSLVVAPRSLVYNWIEEAARFTPRLRACDHTGLSRVCSEESFRDCDLVVTTYGTMRRDILKLREIRFDTVILDEAQAVKNPASQAAKASRLLKADHRLALTGTPVENHLGELWSIFEILNPGMLGSSASFRRLTGGGQPVESDGSGAKSRSDTIEVLARAVRPFLLRRTKETVLSELPAKMEQTQFCELSAKERRRYDELRVHYHSSVRQRVTAEGWNRSQVFVLEALLRLRQAACHPGLLDPDRADEPSAKMEALLEELREVVAGGHKALVFSQFTKFLGLVRRRLDAEGLVYEYLDGQTRDRAERVRRFQTDDACPLFLISLRAGGQGLNLTAADYVFILDPWWNPAVEAQAVDRAHRIGQTRRVFAYRLVARDTVEEKILKLQESKRALSDAILSENEGMLRSLTAEDLEMLLG